MVQEHAKDLDDLGDGRRRQPLVEKAFAGALDVAGRELRQALGAELPDDVDPGQAFIAARSVRSEVADHVAPVGDVFQPAPCPLLDGGARIGLDRSLLDVATELA